MALVTSADRLERLRELLQTLEPPFLLHRFEATPEDYEAITDEDIKCEYIDGELIVHSPASLAHEDLGGFTRSLLREFVVERRLGRVFGPNAVMQLGQRRFSPDVSVLLAQSHGRIHEERVVGPMDLAVEILSQSTRAHDLEKASHLSGGPGRGDLAHRSRSASVHRARACLRRLREPCAGDRDVVLRRAPGSRRPG